METIKLIKNKIRIKLLAIPFIGWIFKRKIKKIIVQTPDGKEHDVTIEQHEEKVCPHRRIEEIAPTVYKCIDCPDAYFFITYKVFARRPELVEFVEKIADHLGAELHDKKEDQR